MPFSELWSQLSEPAPCAMFPSLCLSEFIILCLCHWPGSSEHVLRGRPNSEYGEGCALPLISNFCHNDWKVFWFDCNTDQELITDVGEITDTDTNKRTIF